jgi:hypothetical protein
VSKDYDWGLKPEQVERVRREFAVSVGLEIGPHNALHQRQAREIEEGEA